jgi:hypothetical protein
MGSSDPNRARQGSWMARAFALGQSAIVSSKSVSRAWLCFCMSRLTLVCDPGRRLRQRAKLEAPAASCQGVGVIWGLNLLSAIFALLAAGAWIRSTVVREYPTDKPEPRAPGASYPTPQIGFGRDREGRHTKSDPFYQALKFSARMNTIAAICSGCSATLFGVRLLWFP